MKHFLAIFLISILRLHQLNRGCCKLIHWFISFSSQSTYLIVRLFLLICWHRIEFFFGDLNERIQSLSVITTNYEQVKCENLSEIPNNVDVNDNVVDEAESNAVVDNMLRKLGEKPHFSECDVLLAGSYQ